MIIPVPEDVPPADEIGPVHFVGVGGAALSGLARLMAARGNTVTGSDAHDSPALDQLRSLGIAVSVGHAAEHVTGATTVVVSTAVPEDNPEVVAARAAGLRLWPRAAAVQSLLVGHRAVVVTGTHGKTTTTAMLVSALLAAGADPSYAVGSTILASGVNAAVGADDLFVVEGDESDAAILAYRPHATVVTNVDADHLDFFGTREAYAAVFDAFLDRIEPGGLLVCCVDDPGAARLASLGREKGLHVVGVATAASNTTAEVRGIDVQVDGEGSRCTVLVGGSRAGELSLLVPGRAYVTDALAALAAGLELGYAFAALTAGLAGYRGTSRRMERKGDAAGVTVYDSYAHHPTEVDGDLEAARALLGSGGGRLVVCFQPHLFTRTQHFAADLGVALAAADEVVVLDVYAAREQPLAGVSGELVAHAVRAAGGSARFAPQRGLALEWLVDVAKRGDLVLTLGAGDVTTIGPELLALLARRDGTGHDGPDERMAKP